MITQIDLNLISGRAAISIKSIGLRPVTGPFCGQETAQDAIFTAARCIKLTN
jgi:hypothetical protein